MDTFTLILLSLTAVQQGYGIVCYMDNKALPQKCPESLDTVSQCAIRSKDGSVNKYCEKGKTLGCTTEGSTSICVCEENNCNESLVKAQQSSQSGGSVQQNGGTDTGSNDSTTQNKNAVSYSGPAVLSLIVPVTTFLLTRNLN